MARFDYYFFAALIDLHELGILQNRFVKGSQQEGVRMKYHPLSALVETFYSGS